MDHKMVEKLELVDKWTLNELSDEERAEFESHMFDCPVCAEQVRNSYTVTETLKSKDVYPLRAGWLEWLRLPSLVPTFAALALACVVLYQNAGVGPADMAVLTPAVVLQPVTKGPEIPMVARTSPTIHITFKGDAEPSDGVVCEFKDAAGKLMTTVKIGSLTKSEFELPIELKAKSFPAGQYQMHLVSDKDHEGISYAFRIIDSQ